MFDIGIIGAMDVEVNGLVSRLENKSSETVSGITFYSGELLGKKVADAPQDRLMLDIVWDSVCSDFGLTYSAVMNAPFQWVLNITRPNSTMGLASYMAQYEGKASKTLKKFMERIK